MPLPLAPPTVRTTPITPRTTPGALNNHLAQQLQRSTSPGRSPQPKSPGPSSPSTTQALRSRAVSVTNEKVLSKEENVFSGTERGSYLRLDDAIVNSTRAREESERVMAEVLEGIEKSFPPTDDKRLVCRAYAVQLGRTMGRLRDATVRLEREAADSMQMSTVEKAELSSRLRHTTLQAEGTKKLLEGEVERSEAERSAHGAHMNSEFERLRYERDEESGRLGSEVRVRAHRPSSQAHIVRRCSPCFVLTPRRRHARVRVCTDRPAQRGARDLEGRDADAVAAGAGAAEDHGAGQ